MKKVLVVGGTYFIGRAVLETLNKQEYHVYMLNRGTQSVKIEGVTHLIADRTDPQSMTSALQDIAFNYIIDVSCLNQTHVEVITKTLNLEKLEKIILLSSSSVYKYNPLTAQYNTNSQLGYNKFWDKYGLDKLCAENAYKKFSSEFGIVCDIIRPPYVYGEYNYARRESFVFEHLTKSEPIIIPKKNSLLQFIYVYDLAKIIIELLSHHNNSRINYYNVGNFTAITMAEWVIVCGQVLNTPPTIYRYTGDSYEEKAFFPFHDYDNVLDVSTTKLLFPTETPMIEGLTNSFSWFVAHRSEISFNPKVSQNEQKLLKSMNNLEVFQIT